MRRKIIGVLICLLSSISIAFCGASFNGIPQNGYNMASANSGHESHCCDRYLGNNQINQNLNQNALGLGGISGTSIGPGGFVWLPQNGINIANANGGNNQINQNLNQNALGLSGIGGIGTGSGVGGGLVWIPQNGINIANANGWNNHINQGLNQNGFGY